MGYPSGIFAGVEYDILRSNNGPASTDRSKFDILAEMLEAADAGATAVPLLLPATSDARHPARLGT